jgi:hypothetical protein
MATRPVICPPDGPEGFLFNRGDLVLDDGTQSTPPTYLIMSDLELEVETYSRSRVTLRPGKSSLISQTDIADEKGYVSFIAIRADYPAGTVESRKYINWLYKGNLNYMGELMVLSGKRMSSVDSTDEGWNLSHPNLFTNNGGIIISNPHSDITVKLEILMGR